MKFEDVITNLATKNAIRRSANIGKDFRGQVEKEDLLAQKKLFLNEKRICDEFCKYDDNFDLRRLLLFLFLNKEGYSINSDLKVVETEINKGKFWPEPLIQFNLSFEQGESAQSLCDKGILHPDLSKIFKNYDLFKHRVVEPVLPMDLMGVYILLPDRANRKNGGRNLRLPIKI